ncbi:MAG: biopolymer transporter ExbD [Proteobacteria bacterium]|nr:biopolymer transporter ExbD [Pseudomonadota bacterium]
MRRKHASAQEEAEIDLTPMLDIVFIMLIFFIVTATFVKEEGLLVSKPAEAPEEQKPDKDLKNIQMTVTEDCWVILERRRIDPGQVAPRVQGLIASRPGAPAIVTILGDAKTECVVEVMDQVIQGGVARDMLTLRKQEVPKS